MERDEVGELLQAAATGDVDALAACYERSASVVFNLLQYALGESAAAERATVQVYVRVWRTASAFDPATMSGCTFLMRAVRQELDGRKRGDDARGARADQAWRDVAAPRG